jgi:protein-S-isoprenylcysteine O-methyltransferase Ste14
MQLTAPSAAFLLGTFAYLGVRGYYKQKTSGGSAATSRSSGRDMTLVGLVVAGQIVLPLVAIFSPFLQWAQYTIGDSALAWCGSLVMASGIWLFWRSHADLGENWSVTLEVQKDHKLVSDGVYRKIRHPMYASFFLMAFGQLFLLQNWVAGPSALLAVTLLYVIRKPTEEAMLIEQFGEAYRKYMNSTGGILPK